MPELCNRGNQAIGSICGAPIGDRFREQKSFQRSEGAIPVPHRRQLLERLLELLGEREDRILEALHSDLGKPGVEAWLAEVFFLRKELENILKHLDRWVRPRRAGHPIYFLPAVSRIHREPFGVVLVMSPWNYPLQLALSPAIAAVAAGNSVIIKPSEVAPATATVIAELVADAADARYLTVIPGGAETGASLLEQDFDFFFFTGGEKVGRLVAEAAARRLVPCVLELGGKSPAVIDHSTKLGAAVERAVLGKFFNGGQTCMAPDFLLVPEDLLGEVMERIAEVVAECYGGERPEMARCVDQRQYRRMTSLIPPHAEQIGEDDPSSGFLAPRWAVVDWEHPSMREEVFGPFLPVVGYSGDEECIARLGRMPSPLAIYVFSERAGFIRELLRRVRSGSVCINDVIKQATNPGLPFGGVGESGHGRYRGKAGFDTFTYERPVTRRFMIRDLFQLKPPYGDMLDRMRRWLR